ncbi:MAG: SIMPL domain-containing protein [Acidimicrobiales bacterium]|jgi:uncharacterized protein YggE
MSETTDTETPAARRTGRRRLLVVAGVAAVGLGGLAAAACTSSSPSAASVASCSSTSAKLTVAGSGLATGTPDTLTVDITIAVSGATAQEALADDDTSAASMIAAFTAGGVTKQNIQTTNLSIQPNYTLTNGKETLTGYGVNNTVTAEITDLGTAGTVLDAVSGAAGNAGQINSVSFSIKDIRDLEDQARTDAVHQAVSHARTMAAAAGERLGPVCSLTDTTSSSQGFPTANSSAGAPGFSAAVPLAVGSQQASAQVTVVYSLETGPTTS